MPIGLNDYDHDSIWRYDQTDTLANYTNVPTTSQLLPTANLEVLSNLIRGLYLKKDSVVHHIYGTIAKLGSLTLVMIRSIMYKKIKF